MKQKRFTLAMIVVLVLTTVFSSITLSAASQNPQMLEDNTVRPRFVAILTGSNLLELRSGGKLFCSGDTETRPGYTAGLVLELQKQNSGNSWSAIKTWTEEYANWCYLGADWYVVNGTYRLKVTHYAKDSNGNLVDSYIIYSKTVVY